MNALSIVGQFVDFCPKNRTERLKKWGSTVGNVEQIVRRCKIRNSRTRPVTRLLYQYSLMKNALATALSNLPNSVASLQQITSINSKFIPPYVSLIPHHQQSCYQDTES
ncbi:hypothetical protein T07_9981 [Trichinella nelsoni]|uniref:Uncharacterized protein n=1 Tax=Trichinella nelsoni TaxID=6336 RepID=A0A0V0RXE4_9BILA|nr:hypothetical protein T07_9981 [Trichinella nelsoni]